MSDNTPQIEAILEELTEMCCTAVGNEKSLDHNRVNELVQSLSTNGWQRHSSDGPPLGTVIEKRVLARCKEPAMHRGAGVTAIVNEIQQRFEGEKPDSANAPQS